METIIRNCRSTVEVDGAAPLRRKRVLVSAYACEPDHGSEPCVGWNVVMGLAAFHDVWVLVRECHRAVIEAYLSRHPTTNPRFVFYSGWGKDKGYRSGLHVQLHYPAWQLGAYFVARSLHQQLEFDLVHHVTYVRYWTPSLLWLLPAPFIFGPVGGGETTPRTLRRTLPFRSRLSEALRDSMRHFAEYDPLVRASARRSAIALATTEETAARLRAIGAPVVETTLAARMTSGELSELASISDPPSSRVRFISIGRLLHWKGIHLGLQAFQRAAIPSAEYWVVGDGPERSRLQELANRLGIGDRVHFFGFVPRQTVLSQLAEAHCLVHPSFHDSGGFVCLEAMAARRPVICLCAGGPGVMVDDKSGFPIRPGDPAEVVEEIARAMVTLTSNPELRISMGQSAHERVRSHFTYAALVQQIDALYRKYARPPLHKTVLPSSPCQLA